MATGPNDARLHDGSIALAVQSKAKALKADRPSFASAMTLVRLTTTPARTERVDLLHAVGRIVASPVVAISSNPSFDVAAMDGYAMAWRDVEAASLNEPVILPLVEAVRPGVMPPKARPATAAPISTGAMMPDGFDAVMTKETATLAQTAAGPGVRVDQPIVGFRNVRRIGEDALAGSVVASAGLKITGVAVGEMASYGIRSVEVYRLPGIALLQTGDELSRYATAPVSASIHDANGPMIEAMAWEAGIPLLRREQCGDDHGAILARIMRMIDDPACDIIVTTGGVSAGDYDWIPGILEELGAQIIFRGVRMRPGKPVLLAVLPGGKLFFGLPGNPVAAALGFRFLVCGAVRATWGLPLEQGEPLPVEGPAVPGTTVFLKVRRTFGDIPAVEIMAGQQSHIMRPLIKANGWLSICERGLATFYPLAAPL